jgi:hypothetical protein
MEKSIQYTRADIWLFLCISAYFIMNGAGLWETVIMVPAWTAAPPASLIFFKAPYGLDFKVFWIAVHAVHEVIFITALIFNWGIKNRRIPLLMIFAGHVAVRAWTLMYFAPTLMYFQQIPFSDTVDITLQEKAARWRDLNYLRVGIFFALNLMLLPLLISKKVKRD